jgi:hypothetical protein
MNPSLSALVYLVDNQAEGKAEKSQDARCSSSSPVQLGDGFGGVLRLFQISLPPTKILA